MLKPLLLLMLLTLPGCAARQPAPENPTAEAAREASYRVVLINRTDATLSYDYSRYLPPEAQRDQILEDPYGTPQPSQSLSVSLSSSELAPGESALLDVLPNSPLNVTYQQAGEKKSAQQAMTSPMQVVVTSAGLKQEALPVHYQTGK